LKFGFGNTDLDWTPYEISQINWYVLDYYVGEKVFEVVYAKISYATHVN
jgi:hypothetical protein